MSRSAANGIPKPEAFPSNREFNQHVTDRLNQQHGTNNWALVELGNIDEGDAIPCFHLMLQQKIAAALAGNEN